ncbi:MAG: hypothetical protein LBR25_04180 [Erysipelotrichaceae bacterium]|jgi:hypothetical protein|nr:hypothetical protein [Erysipelotrichaceae bacterium]
MSDDWLLDVRERQKRKCQILFTKTNPLLNDLKAFLNQASHQAIILWALELAGPVVEDLRDKYPRQNRPLLAYQAAVGWAKGKIKMPDAKRAILDCHGLAKELSEPTDIALCHAVGQACSCVHTAGHALGFVMYELTSIVFSFPENMWPAACPVWVRYYEDRLKYWMAHYDRSPWTWAGFLQTQS